MHETLRGKDCTCTQIITAHQLLPLSHLFTQELGLAETWTHVLCRNVPYTLYMKIVGWKSLRNTAVCVVVCERRLGQYLEPNTHNSSQLQSVFSIKFSQPISACSFHIGGRLSGEPQHDRKVLLQRYTGPYLIPFQ